MDLEHIINFCLSKPHTSESFPFDNDTLVFKVKDKMFALTSLKGWEEGQPSLNIKCDPKQAEFLREEYESVLPGYHMNKKHWITINLQNSDLHHEHLLELIEDSYLLVVQNLPKKDQFSLH